MNKVNILKMCNVKTEYKKMVMYKKLIFVCHIKMKFYFLTRDYILVAM